MSTEILRWRIRRYPLVDPVADWLEAGRRTFWTFWSFASPTVLVTAAAPRRARTRGDRGRAGE